MKKKLITACILLTLALTSCGNEALLDTTYTFRNAQIKMPDGTVVSGQVDSWKDFDNSDQIQVKINGKTYLTHSSNVVLIAGK